MSVYCQCAIRGQPRRLSSTGGGSDAARSIFLDGTTSSTAKSNSITAVVQHQVNTKRCLYRSSMINKNRFITHEQQVVGSTRYQVRSLSSTVPVAAAAATGTGTGTNDTSQEQGIKLFVGAMIASFIAGSALAFATATKSTSSPSSSTTEASLILSSKKNSTHSMTNDDNLHIPRNDPGGGSSSSGKKPSILNSNLFVASQQTAVASCDGFDMKLPLSSLNGDNNSTSSILDTISSKTGTKIKLRQRRLQRRNTPSSSDDDYHYNDSSSNNSNYKELSMFGYTVNTATSASTSEGSTATDAEWSIRNASRKEVSKAPFDISIGALQGGRMTMEDEYMIADGGRFVAVFDGHGGNGVSRYLKHNLYRTMKQHLQRKYWEDSELQSGIIQSYNTTTSSEAQVNPNQQQTLAVSHHYDQEIKPNRHGWFDKVLWNQSTKDEVTNAQAIGAQSNSSTMPSVASYVAALRSAFAEIEANVITNDDLEAQGSTAVAVIVHESDDGHRTVLSANVGDSRAILCRNNATIDLTRDHKPNDAREKARIFSMGETIEWDRLARVHRVRTLSLSRAIGDRYAKPVVSSDVEIAHYPIPPSTSTSTNSKSNNDTTATTNNSSNDFILLASDGLWDVMSSNDVVQYVQSVMELKLKQQQANNNKNDTHNYKFLLRKQMAKAVAQEAIKRGSADNVCVVMVWLCDLEQK